MLVSRNDFVTVTVDSQVQTREEPFWSSSISSSSSSSKVFVLVFSSLQTVQSPDRSLLLCSMKSKMPWSACRGLHRDCCRVKGICSCGQAVAPRAPSRSRSRSRSARRQGGDFYGHVEPDVNEWEPQYEADDWVPQDWDEWEPDGEVSEE